MAVQNLQPINSSGNHPIIGLHIGPRLHLRLCAELLDLANTRAKLTHDLRSVETRSEALLSLVMGATR